MDLQPGNPEGDIYEGFWSYMRELVEAATTSEDENRFHTRADRAEKHLAPYRNHMLSLYKAVGDQKVKDPVQIQSMLSNAKQIQEVLAAADASFSEARKCLSERLRGGQTSSLSTT